MIRGIISIVTVPTIVGSVLSVKYLTRPVPISPNEVIHAWLVAEALNVNHDFYDRYKHAMALHNVTSMDVVTGLKVDELRRVLQHVRGKILWYPIENVTTWYRQYKIIPPSIPILYNLWGNCKIVAPFPNTEARGGKRRLCFNLNGLIMWGHSLDDTLVMVEGNHRFNSRIKWLPYLARVYVGISDDTYPLHANTGCEKCLKNARKPLCGDWQDIYLLDNSPCSNSVK